MNKLIGTSPLGLAMIKRNHATIDSQAKEIKALTATVKEQASQIQEVSDRLARKLLVADRETMTALQQNEFDDTTYWQAKEIKALTATVKEQAS